MTVLSSSRNADLGAASLLLHHTTMCYLTHSRSEKTPKKDLLLIYLLRYRYIFRHQIYDLLSYTTEKIKGADELINRLCRNKQAKKSAVGERSSLDCFSITSEGMNAAAVCFKEEVSTLLQNNLSFAKRCSSILSVNKCTIDECIEYLRNHSAKKRKNLVSHSHLVAMEDSYVALLHLVEPSFFSSIQYEVTYSDGFPISQREQLLITRYLSTDVRSDAVLSLSYSNNKLYPVDIIQEKPLYRILMEQDTASQHAAIITDKLNRYRDNIISPWLSTDEAPPLLLFSLLSTHQGGNGKDEGKYSTKGLYYSTGIALLGEVLSVERGALPATITLGTVEEYLSSLPTQASTAKDYLTFVREQISRFGSLVPAAGLRNVYSADKGKRVNEGSDLITKYTSRRSTIFNSAERSTGWLPLFLRGVSLATIPNSHASSLLSLLPAYCSFETTLERLPAVSVNGHGGIVKFEPFSTFQLSGTKITFRNCYTGTEGRKYVVENVSDDYGGYVRVITALSSGEDLPFSLILLMRTQDTATILPRIKESLGQRNSERVYVCHYSVTGGCEAPVFNTPIRLSLI